VPSVKYILILWILALGCLYFVSEAVEESIKNQIEQEKLFDRTRGEW
jgi:hypothetical protein